MELSSGELIRLLLIFGIIIFFIVGMMRKKISTIIALPAMGILVALIATIGQVDGNFFGLYSHENIYGTVDETTGEVAVQAGIMSAVIADGSKMMASAIVSAICGGALAVMLKKMGVIEAIVKKIAELAGDKPMMIAILFFVASTVIFMAIGGLGPVIIIGTVALPIMMSAGINPKHAAYVVLLGLSAGGVMNPANWATYTTLLAETGMDPAAAYEMVLTMSFAIFAIVVAVSMAFIVLKVRSTTYRRAWAMSADVTNTKKVSTALLFAPVVPIVIIFASFFNTKLNPGTELITPEIAIVLGMVYALLVSRTKNKAQTLTSSFIEGTQEVSGAIVLLIGLGILIKGFQYYTVTPLIAPFTTMLVEYLQNPMFYVIGFTIATPLVLYRGPLNTFGIGGSIPAIFAAAGFSPMATIYALRAVGNLQGFGDPTNSQNIWIADFVKVDGNEMAKEFILLGMVMTFIILLMAVIMNPGMLG